MVIPWDDCGGGFPLTSNDSPLTLKNEEITHLFLKINMMPHMTNESTCITKIVR